jgi:hypothetical protein
MTWVMRWLGVEEARSGWMNSNVSEADALGDFQELAASGISGRCLQH